MSAWFTIKTYRLVSLQNRGFASSVGAEHFITFPVFEKCSSSLPDRFCSLRFSVVDRDLKSSQAVRRRILLAQRNIPSLLNQNPSSIPSCFAPPSSSRLALFVPPKHHYHLPVTHSILACFLRFTSNNSEAIDPVSRSWTKMTLSSSFVGAV